MQKLSYLCSRSDVYENKHQVAGKTKKYEKENQRYCWVVLTDSCEDEDMGLDGELELEIEVLADLCSI